MQQFDRKRRELPPNVVFLRNTLRERSREYRAILATSVLLMLALWGCATAGPAKGGIVQLDEQGKTKPVTQEEIAQLAGGDNPYLIQVGDILAVNFRLKAARAGEPAWDYRIEPGDSLAVRFLPRSLEPGEYIIETGDVISVTFLDNWQLNVTRTVRPDGMITCPEVGDVLAKGSTALQLRAKLQEAYKKSGLLQGEPRITVNVDFVNTDRYADMNMDVIVRPDGAIRVPGFDHDVPVAGLTAQEASERLAEAAQAYLKNKPKATVIITPAAGPNVLADLTGNYQVKPDGKISLSRLGEVQAAGFSAEELSAALRTAAEGLVHNPIEASVEILKGTGGRIYVGGEVRTPGVYPLEGAPTALQAVLMANGFNNESRLNNVIVIRRNPQGKPIVFKTNLRVALTDGQTQNDIPLRPFDIVYVPKKNIAKADLFVEQYIDRLVPFDNSLGVTAQYYLNTQKTDSRTRNLNFNTGVTGVLDVLNP